MSTTKLTSPVSLVLSPGPSKSITLSSVTLIEIRDNSVAKKASAIIKESPAPIILWSGTDYTAIGDYTQAQAEARLLEIVNALPKATAPASK